MNVFKNKKFTLVHLLALSLIVALITFSATSNWESKKYDEQLSSINGAKCKFDIKRLQGLKYIRPLMFADDECESDDLSGIKLKVSQIINRYKTGGDLATASFYLRRYDNSDWTSLNDEEQFEPGSLFKVPVMVAILKMNEDNPGFLDKKVTCRKKYDVGKEVLYTTKSIEVGKSYTIRELLTYMIKYSDNNATALLQYNMSPQVFQKLFEDFGFKVPNFSDTSYYISVTEYSCFMNAIYNAAYLTIKDSEFAAELLTECNFNDGIVKGIPSKTPIAHKFGEAGNQSERQLHETAIVYLDNCPYLLTVMTKGKSNSTLSQVIAEISQAVYFELQGNAIKTL